MEVSGRGVFLTGGAQGIGRAMISALLAKGAKVSCLSVCPSVRLCKGSVRLSVSVFFCLCCFIICLFVQLFPFLPHLFLSRPFLPSFFPLLCLLSCFFLLLLHLFCLLSCFLPIFPPLLLFVFIKMSASRNLAYFLSLSRIFHFRPRSLCLCLINLPDVVSLVCPAVVSFVCPYFVFHSV